MVNIRKANNFLLLLLVVVIMLATFLVQNFNPGSKLSRLRKPSSITTPTVTPAQVQLNINPNQKLDNPAVISGKIDNSWLFEAQFNIQLLDSSQAVIAESPVTINSDQDWTEPGLKDFSITLKYKTNATHGTLVIKSDNPSGLPENQKTYQIPVNF